MRIKGISQNRQGGQSPQEIVATAVLMTTMKRNIRVYQYSKIKHKVKPQLGCGEN